MPPDPARNPEPVVTEDVQRVQGWWAEVAAHFNPPAEPDRDELLEIASRVAVEDFVYEEDPVWPDAGSYTGREAVIDRFMEYTDMLRIDRIEVGEAIQGEGLVYIPVRIQMLSDAATAGPSFLWGYTIKVENGRITHMRAWFDPEEGRRAAGLGT